MTTSLVTGSNRGIGLAIATRLQERGDEVIAVCRQTSDELDALGVRVIDGIDVADARSIDKLRNALGSQRIDILINNAGALIRDDFGQLDYEAIVDLFEINTLGPLRVTEALANNLAQGSKVAIITSRVGSIEDNSSGGYWAYRLSKAAVNMVGKNLTHEFRPRGIAVALLHPGMVATDMTDRNGIPAARSAEGLVERIDELTLQNSGGFWHAEGYTLPW